MLLKTLLFGLVLVVETFGTKAPIDDQYIQVSNNDNVKYHDKKSEKEYYKKPNKDYSEKKEYYDKKEYDEYKAHKKQKYKDEQGYEKRYKDDQTYEKRYKDQHNRPSADYLNFNEIDSNDYNRAKQDYHGKYQDQDKSKVSLARDTYINFADPHRHINSESEFISLPPKQKQSESYQVNFQNADGSFKRSKKQQFYEEAKAIDLSTPPPADKIVLMARYIVHNVDWAALATLSSHTSAKAMPFVNVVSMSDGPMDKGIGVPFFYLTPKDLSTQDLTRDNKASITMTLAETPYCQSKNLDPEDPRCARLIMLGKIKRIKPATLEEEVAKKALFSRHPDMESWPADHDFFFAKMKIGQIIILDRFGGPSAIDIQEYLNAENPQK